MKTAGSTMKCYRTSSLLGAHFSIAKGLHHALYEAKAYGCNALQIFTKNASTWKERTLIQEEINQFDQAKKETGITEIVSHASYLINLATCDKRKHAMSCSALKKELIRSFRLGIPFVILHPGAHLGNGEAQGIERITLSINEIFSQTPDVQVRLLLETTAGQGSGLGHTFEQLASIRDDIKSKDRIGFCLDTSHIFAAGYDIRNERSYRQVTDNFDAVIGMKNLYVIHLNDSKKELGSRVDRHEHIGEGFIGITAFKLLMNDVRFRDIPKIIETPKRKNGQDCDEINLNRLRSLISGPQPKGNAF